MSAALKYPVPLPMTVRDFMIWDPGDHQRYELVDGLPRAMAPTALPHGVLQNEVGSLIRNHLREHRPGCVVAANPGVSPRVLSAQNVRIPDLGVTCSPVISGEALMHEPILLIEILSPSNYSETWSNVWTYCSIPSLREILVLHSTRMRAEVLRRGADGTWSGEPEQITQGELTLDSIGFRIDLAAVYAGTDVTD